MSRIFLIAGLGADARIYNNLELPGYEVTKVDWLMPDKSDSLTTYAQKLVAQYGIAQGATVIGNSLGGMIGIEIAKMVPLQKVILISSIKTIDEAPAYFKVFQNMPVYNIIPEKLFNSVDFLMEFFFGQMDRTDIGLFQDMLKGWTPEMLRWAMGAALRWDNKVIPPNTYHITGDKDLVFPYKKIKNPTLVKGGTHVMVYDMADEVNNILHRIFANEATPVLLS
jgi:pimeloyl-ACP methyl ester carboxylesterase